MAPKLHDVQKLLGLTPQQIPQHVAIIMDGNGRWARQRGLPRFEGHRQGAKTVKRITLEARKLGIRFLTLYSFSTENWKRPREEVELLMHLCAEYLVHERDTLIEHDVRLVHVGREQELPDLVVQKLHETRDATAGGTGMVLALALNYSSRVEITDAVQAIAREAAAKRLDPDQITPQTIAQRLYTADIPDPDLLIRTANEKRLSNFLLWQLSYTEFHIAKVLWPDFRESHLRRALQTYARRERRFGDVKPAS